MTAAAIGDWRELASCARGYNPELWYPRDADAFDERSEAIAICRRCPVRAECLAAGADEDHGIWGGLTSRQRHKLKKKRDMVIAVGSVRRLRALACLGYNRGHLACELAGGPTPLTTSYLGWVMNGATLIPAAKAAVIADLYARLVARGPSTAPRNAISRRHADRKGWLGPDCWQGVDMDDPNAQPRGARAAA